MRLLLFRFPGDRLMARPRGRRNGARGPGSWGVAIVVGWLALSSNQEGTVVHAEPCVVLRVRPQIMIARGDIRIEARIVRHPDHRAYAIIVTSPDGYETISGPRELSGVDGPALVDLLLRSYSAAHYNIEIRIYDQLGRIVGRDRQSIQTADGSSRPE